MQQFFTPEERHLVLMAMRPMTPERSFWYMVYVLPSALFATYALLHKEFAAGLVAYIALLIPSLMYLSRGARHAALWCSILAKYEAKVGALSESQA
jgi:hypothetical protein